MSLNELASGLLKASHSQALEIKKAAEEVNSKWDALCRAIQNRAKVSVFATVRVLYLLHIIYFNVQQKSFKMPPTRPKQFFRNVRFLGAGVRKVGRASP